MDTNAITFKTQTQKYQSNYSRVYPIPLPAVDKSFYNWLNNKVSSPYLYDVTGIFSVTASKKSLEVRANAIRIVKKMGLKSNLGIYPRPTKPQHQLPIPNDVECKRVDMHKHWDLQYVSKINLSLQGLGYFCYRETEIMGMGGFCLREDNENVLFCGGFKDAVGLCKCDLSDLNIKIDYYLTHDKEMGDIRQRGIEYYDKYMSPLGQLNYILKKVKENI